MTGSRPGGCGFLQSGPRPLPWILPPLRNPEIRRRQGKHWPGLCNLGILQGCSSPVAHDSSLTTISSPGYLPPQIGEGQANLGREVTVSSLGTQHLFLGAPPAMVAGTFSAVPCLPRHVPSWARPDAGGAPCVSPQSHLAPQWQASFSPGPLGPWRNVQFHPRPASPRPMPILSFSLTHSSSWALVMVLGALLTCPGLSLALTPDLAHPLHSTFSKGDLRT